MESAAREINLTDIADRAEKIIHEAMHIRERLEQAGATLRGGGGVDANGANTPMPSGLIPLISYRLGIIEAIQSEQRQALNRIQDALCEAPPPAQLSAPNMAPAKSLQSRY